MRNHLVHRDGGDSGSPELRAEGMESVRAISDGVPGWENTAGHGGRAACTPPDPGAKAARSRLSGPGGLRAQGDQVRA
ncbi:hypothetical protein [Nonomuraea ferruginea]|uniref:Uncharacterized protein n=1 Tax=Nonomuraea ferruginea TaxID=46174 RepID=A0ABT4T3I2_9ACTN|nr:hypothetical protein [Nonomuraea ferruginea]MDA0644049.1 hypothetical protein [Nonomuraea ferruginea]